MKHIDILIHVLCLLSGIITALLGFLLYLKYKINVIRNYAFFILTTTFTVATTTTMGYLSYFTNIGQNSLFQIISSLLFEIFIIFINYAFTLFALGIINKPFTVFNKILLGIPCLFVLISILTGYYYNIGKEKLIIPPINNTYFMIILFSLFLTLVIYSVRIAINLKYFDNLDLKRALKTLALLFIVYIPLQSLIIRLNGQWIVIMLSRNLFYFSINIISIVFAAKYFFIKTPSIMDQIEISDNFINKYAITEREKEVIELLLSGLSIKEISGKLDRSFKTINNHIYNIYQKAHVSSKLELLNVIKENMI